MKDDGDIQVISYDSHQQQEEEGSIFYLMSLEVLKTLSGDEEISVLDNEVIEGIQCYHIQLSINKTNLEKWLRWFQLSMNHESKDIKVDQVVITDATLDIWVSKNKALPIQVITKIPSMTYTVRDNGTSYEIYLKNLEETTNFANWGEIQTIEAPL
jgi:hypothetical protein